MTTTEHQPSGLLQFRTRAVSVMATSLAIGMLVLAVMLPFTTPTIVLRDVVLLVVAATVHATAALTVGRRWEPGGVVCAGYLALVTLVVALAFVDAASPASDGFWFLLIPVGLSGLSMGGRDHALITAGAVAAYHAASVVGPGYAVALVVPRTGALVLFAWAMWAVTHRLEQGLREADEARATMEQHLADVRKLNTQLTELDRLKDDFVSTASHELRTPLTVIMGFAATLNVRWDQLDTDQRRDLSTRIEAHARSLEGIVATLLDTARIERGALTPSRDRVPLETAVGSTVDRLRPLLREHEVRTELEPALAVSTDARLLERVLDNLLANAARHTPSGTHVTVVGASDGHGVVRVEVRDSGPGIPPHEVERLGEPFFRAGDPDTRTRDGVGLGLALVRDVLAALDSELEVDSTVGVGTTFAFTLPTWGDDREPSTV